MLEAAGYREIGMDHFALTSDELFKAATSGALHRNFMGYTPAFTRPLLGLGVSAISDSGDAFVQNEKNLQQYQERVTKGELPIQRGHLLNEEDVVIRGHILSLMTHFETHWNPGDDYTPFLDGVIERLRELDADHLVETTDRQVRVTDTGRAFLRNVCMAFDARLIRKAPATQLFSQTA
jgi:oxygen-independent coproporphyrinogen-3 oxidase